MKNKISLHQIASAIGRNCVIDKLSSKPLTLKKYQHGNKNKSIGRYLFIYFAHVEGFDQDEVASYLEIAKNGYEKEWARMSELRDRGQDLFEARTRDASDSALYFYRKMKIIEATLYRPYA